MEPRARFAPKPPWLKVRAPGGERYGALKETFRRLDLHTVCEEARCPNVGECWAEGTATVMLLGDTCTRGCRFCAVKTGQPRGAVDVREPEHVARALSSMPLQYVVMTMVDRDDLLDGGADHVAKTVRRLKELRPDMLVETLVGDFGGHMHAVDTTVDARPDVWAHNIEVVRRLQRVIRDARCSYEQSLAVLRRAKERVPGTITKSSIMVGIGESDDEVVETMRDLRVGGRRRGHDRPVPAADDPACGSRSVRRARAFRRLRRGGPSDGLLVRRLRAARAKLVQGRRGVRAERASSGRPRRCGCPSSRAPRPRPCAEHERVRGARGRVAHSGACARAWMRTRIARRAMPYGL